MEEWTGGWRRCLTPSFEGWGEIYQFGEYCDRALLWEQQAHCPPGSGGVPWACSEEEVISF